MSALLPPFAQNGPSPLGFRRYQAADLPALAVDLPAGLDPRALEGDFAWVATRAGAVVAGGFVIPQSTGRALAFCSVERLELADWPRALRFLRGMLRSVHLAGFWRIEADCRRDFAPGHRLLRHLGFAIEGELVAYAADGADHIAYARIDTRVLAARRRFLQRGAA